VTRGYARAPHKWNAEALKEHAARQDQKISIEERKGTYMTKIVICGATGKMGKMIANLALKDKDLKIVGAIDRESIPEFGQDLGDALGTAKIGVNVTSDLAKAAEDADCVIEFTLPEPTLKHLAVCEQAGKPMVIATTGIDEAGNKAIENASKKIPVVYTPNMSIGVNLMFKLLAEAAKVLGKDFSIKGDETHHIHKKDSPSGTAKMMSKVIKDACGKDVVFEAFREGEVVGNHGVIFESGSETLEIRHDAKSREVFASGSIKAAKFLAGKKPGLYKMADVLGL
jgi:4-hydroxy-tetrahydrodipicolinate reductase